MDNFEANRFSSKADIGSIVQSILNNTWDDPPACSGGCCGDCSPRFAHNASHCEHANSATDKQRLRARRALFSSPQRLCRFQRTAMPHNARALPAGVSSNESMPEPGSRRFGMLAVRLKTRRGPAPVVDPRLLRLPRGPLRLRQQRQNSRAVTGRPSPTCCRQSEHP
jgi:hypothetical protein